MYNYSDLYQQQLIAKQMITHQYAIIQEQALTTEKRATEIFEIVVNNPECYYYIHSVLAFEKIDGNFLNELADCVAEYIHFKNGKYKLDLEHLKIQYRKAVLKLIRFRKQIYNEIILNALQDIEKEIETEDSKSKMLDTSIDTKEVKKIVSKKS